MDSSQCSQLDEQILLAKLPVLAWQLVLGSLGTDFQTLEKFSEATNLFNKLILRNGQVFLGHDKILPNIYREWLDKDYSSTSEPMLLLFTLVTLKPKITTFEIAIDPNFRPGNYTLNLFLKLQSDNLETFHISCVGLELDPVILRITEEKMKNVWDLKVLRSVTRSMRRLDVDFHKSLNFVMPEQWNFPALEKLTVSLLFLENWSDFFQTPSDDSDYYLIPKVGPTPVKHLRFIDFSTTPVDYGRWHNESDSAVSGALKVFPNLVSLEIPCVDLQQIYLKEAVKNLKRLTLTLPSSERHIHVFDTCITGYGMEVCAALFANPVRDPVQVREEIEEENARQIANGERERRESVTANNMYRRNGKRLGNLTHFKSLEILRIKSESSLWGPTDVSCLDFLNMKSLKVLDLCGNKPIHISEEMLRKMRKSVNVLCE